MTDLDAVVARLPAGERRHGQSEMADAVDRALDQDRHLIVQAGTGTGKTLAYLVPIVNSGRKAIVATATKALQDQLRHKDLPFLVEAYGPFRSAVLKGRANYLCRQRLEEIEADRQGRLAGTDLGPELAEIVAWAQETATGDRADLDVEPAAETWEAVSVTSREGPGARNCPQGGACFAEAARARAAEADVVIVNTHLYGTHLAAENSVLPDHDVVVFDEAHRLEEVISATAGIEITAGRVNAVANTAVRILAPDDDVIVSLREAATALGSDLEIRSGQALDPIPGDLEQTLDRLRSALDRAGAAIREISTSDPSASTRRLSALSAVGALSTDLVTVRLAGDEMVCWVEGDGGRARLRLAPVDVAEYLAERLWGDVTALLTSATIRSDAGSRLGLDPRRTDYLDVGSPFDFAEQAVLYCAAHLPDPRHESWAAAVHTEMAQLILAAGGRALCLFTSWRAMSAAAEALANVVGVPVLVQGSQPKPALIREFTETVDSCLFATLSFWEGLDVPGPALSLVTVDRLPFARPDDPLMEARRRAAGPDAFSVIDVPRAATLLAQGVGRLIRTSTDRGVVAVLDRRLATARYRWDLVNALPPMRRTRDPEEVRTFLRNLRAESPDDPAPDV